MNLPSALPFTIQFTSCFRLFAKDSSSASIWAEHDCPVYWYTCCKLWIPPPNLTTLDAHTLSSAWQRPARVMQDMIPHLSCFTNLWTGVASFSLKSTHAPTTAVALPIKFVLVMLADYLLVGFPLRFLCISRKLPLQGYYSDYFVELLCLIFDTLCNYTLESFISRKLCVLFHKASSITILDKS